MANVFHSVTAWQSPVNIILEKYKMQTDHSNSATNLGTYSSLELQIRLAGLLAEDDQTRNEANLRRILGNYQIGRIVDNICRLDAPRSVALVDEVARQFGFCGSTLFRYRAIALQFDEAEIDSMLRRRTCRRKAISFSHLKVLSRVWDREARRQFLDAVFAEDLSSEQLRQRIMAWETSGTSWAAVLAGMAANIPSTTVASAQAL